MLIYILQKGVIAPGTRVSVMASVCLGGFVCLEVDLWICMFGGGYVTTPTATAIDTISTGARPQEDEHTRQKFGKTGSMTAILDGARR